MAGQDHRQNREGGRVEEMLAADSDQEFRGDRHRAGGGRHPQRIAAQQKGQRETGDERRPQIEAGQTDEPGGDDLRRHRCEDRDETRREVGAHAEVRDVPGEQRGKRRDLPDTRVAEPRRQTRLDRRLGHSAHAGRGEHHTHASPPIPLLDGTIDASARGGIPAKMCLNRAGVAYAEGLRTTPRRNRGPSARHYRLAPIAARSNSLDRSSSRSRSWRWSIKWRYRRRGLAHPAFIEALRGCDQQFLLQGCDPGSQATCSRRRDSGEPGRRRHRRRGRTSWHLLRLAGIRVEKASARQGRQEIRAEAKRHGPNPASSRTLILSCSPQAECQSVRHDRGLDAAAERTCLR